MKTDTKVVLLDGSRTPIGTLGRSLKLTSAAKMLGHTIKHALRRAGVNASAVDQVIVGHGFQSGYEPNTARTTWLEEGLPASVPAVTVQRQCGSGMEAVYVGADRIRSGDADIVLAGGVESMSLVPYLTPGKERWSKWTDFVEKKIGIPRMGPRPASTLLFGALTLVVALLGLIVTPFLHGFGYFALAMAAGLGAYTAWVTFRDMPDNGIAPRSMLKDMRSVYMSGTAQCLADNYGISRQAMDEYALRSQVLAKQAIKSGRFAIEIDPIEIPGRGYMSNDEHPRETSLEKLGKLKGVLGTKNITAGNSSGINDGACSLVIASEAKAKELGVEPLCEIVDTVVAGVDPIQMGLGPVAAITKLLERNNLTVADVDLIEINEAFAAQYLACEKLLGLNRDKVNVNGGAIALGHPIGMSGARLILTLAHELKIRGLKRGVAALCIGGGQGIATLIERP